MAVRTRLNSYDIRTQFIMEFCMFSTLFSVLFFAFAQAQEPATASSNIGTKGAWGEAVKLEFLQSCNGARPPQIEASIMSSICMCSLNKLQVLYAPSELGTPEANKKAEEIGASCAMGSKGAWSDLIKSQFMYGCETAKPEGITAAAMKNICACSLTMIESNYGPQELETEAAVKFSEQAGELCAKQELSK